MASQQTIPKGYKHTEVGIIPSDWEVKLLNKVGSFKKGKNIKKDSVLPDGLPCVRYGEIYTHHNDYIKRFNSYISRETAKASQRIKRGDLLFAGSGETAEEIGKCVAYLGDDEAYAGGDVIILSPEGHDSKYLGFLMNYRSVVAQKSQLGQGDAVVHIYPSNMGGMLIPLPPTEAEESAIATALSEADALIESLQKLIAKKRAIKQGAMQELLTGKRRLPGFKGKWGTIKLGEVLRVRHGKSQKAVASDMGIYPILASGGEIGRATQYLYNKPSVLIGRKGTIDTPQYMDNPFWSVDTLFYTEILKDNCPKFIYYKFQIIDWYLYNEASGVPSLNARTIENIECVFPNDPKEQTAIANLLSDMDSEITSLEQKLDKYKQLKQGMMQVLLTGKVRLV
jgi:type I restriction enzyme, S subunit